MGTVASPGAKSAPVDPCTQCGGHNTCGTQAAHRQGANAATANLHTHGRHAQQRIWQAASGVVGFCFFGGLLFQVIHFLLQQRV